MGRCAVQYTPVWRPPWRVILALALGWAAGGATLWLGGGWWAPLIAFAAALAALLWLWSGRKPGVSGW